MVRKFFRRLLWRGYNLKELTTSFQEASAYLEGKHNSRRIFVSAATKRKRKNKEPEAKDNDDNTDLYYHAEYHPRGVPRRDIQQAYTDTLRKTGLFKRQIVAFSRPKNIGDLLSPSDLPERTGNNPSNYLIVMSQT